MSTFYFLALCGVCVIVLAVMIEAIVRVTRRPDWQLPTYAFEAAAEPMTQEEAVLPVEARHSGFVGLTNNEEFLLKA